MRRLLHSLFTLLTFAFLVHCGPTEVCTPGKKVECTCSGNTKGTKTCSDDGSTYSACSCPNQEPPKEYSNENDQEEITLENTLPDERFSEESPKEKTPDAGHHEENTQVEAPTEKHPEPEQIVEKECTPNTTRSCYNGPTGTNSIGECKPGQQICSKEGAWSLCAGQILPTQESCNGKDDDCNGMTDDTYPEKDKACDTQKPGICKDGVYQCTNGKLECRQTNTPKTEECNNIDDDCDGQIDEELKQDCYSGPSQTEGVGTCKKGEQTCTAGKWGLCSGEVIPQSEVCNGKDDDCNGIIDQSYAPKLCPANQTCETGVCLVQCKEDADCPNKTNCQNGLCKSFTCQSPLQACVHTCVDVSSNAEHCGACYQSCSSIQACSNSACVCDLNTAQICNGVCTDVSFNDANCGTCGTTCTNGTLCVEKKCTTSWAQKVELYGSVGLIKSRIQSTTIDSNENIYVAGVFEKEAIFGNTTITTPNLDTKGSAFLAKMSKRGQWLWAKRISYSTNDSVKILETDNTGNIYILGRFEGKATFGNTVLTGGSIVQEYIAKMDASGKWLWAIKANTNIVAMKYIKNSLYIAGYAGGVTFGSHTPNWLGGYDIFLAKLDSSGNWIWVEVAGSPGTDSAYWMDVDGNGDIYITGKVNQTAKFGSVTHSISSGANTSFIAKFSTNTNKWLWVKSGFGGAFATTNAGHLLVAGSFRSTLTLGNFTKTVVGVQDAFIAMMDNNGSWKWVNTIGGPNAVTAGSFAAEGKNGNFLFAGYSDRVVQIGTTKLDPTKGRLFVVGLDSQGTWKQSIQDGVGDPKFALSQRTFDIYNGRIVSVGEFLAPTTLAGKLLKAQKYYPMFIWSFPTF